MCQPENITLRVVLKDIVLVGNKGTYSDYQTSHIQANRKSSIRIFMVKSIKPRASCYKYLEVSA